MGRRKIEDNAMDLVALLTSKGRTQIEIQRALGYSAATVSRLIRDAVVAEKLFFPLPKLKLNPQDLARAERDLFDDKPLREDLIALSNGTLKDLFVVPTSSILFAERIQEFSAGAADYIIEKVLNHSSVAAIAWGKTIRTLVKEICLSAGRSKLPPRDKSIEFVQACGDPPDAIKDPSLRSSSLVADLESAFKRKPNPQYTFSTSATIPANLQQDGQLGPIREYIHQCGGYGGIFRLDDNKRQRIDFDALKVDTLITSCGSNNPNLDTWLHYCGNEVAGGSKHLSKLTIGNIAGNWLPVSRNPSREELKKIEKVNRSWNGIVLEDILEIRKRGEVVVAAAGDQDQVILRLLEDGLISRLLVTKEIAEKLCASRGIKSSAK